MHRFGLILIAPLALLVLVALACGTTTPESTATVTIPMPENTATPAMEPASTMAPTDTPEPTPTATLTPIPTPEPTPTPIPSESIADEVARTWANANISEIVDEILALVGGEVRLVGRLAESVLEVQVTDNLELAFSVPPEYRRGCISPTRHGDDRHRVRITGDWGQEVYGGLAIRCRY